MHMSTDEFLATVTLRLPVSIKVRLREEAHFAQSTIQAFVSEALSREIERRRAIREKGAKSKKAR